MDSAVIPTAAGDWLELDVTSQIASELAGDKTLSVVIISDDSNLDSYYSREAVSELDRPQLEIYGNVDADWSELSFVAQSHETDDGFEVKYSATAVLPG